MQAADYSSEDQVLADFEAFEAAILLEGWTKDIRFLTEDLILHSVQGPANTAEYTILRDDQNNTYIDILPSLKG